MKKYLKIISIPFMTILFVFVGIMTVNAAYGGTFTVKLKALGLGGDKATDWVNPPANYAYVSDVTIQTVNGDKYDVFYQTSYNSSDVTVGGKLYGSLLEEMHMGDHILLMHQNNVLDKILTLTIVL